MNTVIRESNIKKRGTLILMHEKSPLLFYDFPPYYFSLLKGRLVLTGHMKRMKSEIQIFKRQPVRATWDEEGEKGWIF